MQYKHLYIQFELLFITSISTDTLLKKEMNHFKSTM